MLKELNQVMEYIEDHLTDEGLSLDKISSFAGVSDYHFEGVNEAIVSLAKNITKEQREELHRLKNVEPMEIINESYEADYHFEKEEGHLTHHIGVLTTEETAGEGLELIPVPEASWAMLIARSGFR